MNFDKIQRNGATPKKAATKPRATQARLENRLMREIRSVQGRPRRNRDAFNPRPPNSGAVVAYSSQQGSSSPVITNGNNWIRIRHRELVQSVNGSVAFTATKIACNPGLSATFPWLAPQALQWEQYKFHKLFFEYVTRTSTSTVGSVLLAPDYDPADQAPTTEAITSTYEDCREDVCWRSITCRLSPRAMNALGPRKFVRSTAVAATDIKTYDSANFYLCTVEQVGATAIGKLWVEYDVELSVPQSPGATTNTSSSSSFYQRDTAQTLTTATPAPLQWDVATFDPVGFGTSVAGVFTPPSGTFSLSSQLSFANSVAEATTAIVEVLKNGASLTKKAISETRLGSATSAAAILNCSPLCVIVCNGTDTVQFQVTLTGATGTLTSVAGCCQLVVTVA